MPQTPEQAETIERDPTGRFARGNTIGRRGGRPPREIEVEYLTALRKGCPPERLQKIIEVVAKKAERGSLEAAKLLLGHSLPPTTARLDIINYEEYRVAGRSPAEGQASMFERARARIIERREYEAMLRRSGVKFGPTDRESNGSQGQQGT